MRACVRVCVSHLRTRHLVPHNQCETPQLWLLLTHTHTHKHLNTHMPIHTAVILSGPLVRCELCPVSTHTPDVLHLIWIEVNTLQCSVKSDDGDLWVKESLGKNTRQKKEDVC